MTETRRFQAYATGIRTTPADTPRTLQQRKNFTLTTKGLCKMSNKTEITEGEKSLFRWQYRQTGGFEGSLWDAIKQADSGNLALLRKAFPEHVQAYQNFANQSGYWAALRDRIDGGE